MSSLIKSNEAYTRQIGPPDMNTPPASTHKIATAPVASPLDALEAENKRLRDALAAANDTAKAAIEDAQTRGFEAGKRAAEQVRTHESDRLDRLTRDIEQAAHRQFETQQDHVVEIAVFAIRHFASLPDNKRAWLESVIKQAFQAFRDEHALVLCLSPDDFETHDLPSGIGAAPPSGDLTIQLDPRLGSGEFEIVYASDRVQFSLDTLLDEISHTLRDVDATGAAP
ncbi:hypothetical protein RMQ97_14780 [Maricaulis sp. D1M11]|uniref:FliH/SctL family protein n=1 Tax=Maricaulis sp. D1M11 TaxID=3076117 RepID=UPI0039B3EBC0